RLALHKISRLEDGVSEAERLTLADVRDAGELRDGARLPDQPLLAALAQHVLQFERDVEVVLDGGLTAPGDDDDRLDAGQNRLLDDVLDERLINERQHLLRRRLRRRQEARAQARRR